MKYYCIGEKLSHSLSVPIHKVFGEYDYELLELPPEDLGDFFAKRDFAGLNVTVPYKEAVIKYIDEIDATAEKIGAVNTVVNRGGRLVGYNTDFPGFSSLCFENGIDLCGKSVMILGSGGTSKTVRRVSETMNASDIFTVSRSHTGGTFSYEEALKLPVQIIVNTTPVGMYPNGGDVPMEIGGFSSLEAVIDVIYNPIETELVRKAKRLGIKAVGGLYMLLRQGALSSELFTGKTVGEEKIKKAYLLSEEILNENSSDKRA